MEVKTELHAPAPFALGKCLQNLFNRK